MADERQLARTAIELGLFGDNALLEPSQIVAPEKYQLVREIGRGGIGVVWLARERQLGRPVALKFLQEAQAAHLERFRREARFTARLNSPSIVKIYELGESEGRPYIAMEYVDGKNLAEARLDVRSLVKVMREIALALDHAHTNGIIHRDIKPENILIDQTGHAWITDFGIARDVLANPGATLSVMGQIMGTPASMSPEQARGEPHKVNAQSDIYSLGATMFFKLTGRWPFIGDNVVDVLHAVIHEPAPLPRSLVPSLPRSIEAVVLRCLQKKQANRYTTGRHLVEDFDRFLRGERVEMEPGTWFKRLVRKVTGSEAVAAETGQERPKTDTDPFWSIGLEVGRELAEWDSNVYRISRNLPRTFPRLDAIIDRLGRYLEEQPSAAWARFYRGMALFRRGRLPAALEEMEQAINHVGNLAGAHFELGQLYLVLHLADQARARRHLSQRGVEGQLRTSRRLLEQAVIAFEEARSIDEALPGWKSRFVDAVAQLADNDFAACIASCNEILDDDPDSEQVWKLRGDALHLADGDPFESYQRALEIRRSYWEAAVAAAEAHLARRDAAAARRWLERALEIHPEHVEIHTLLARACLIEGRCDPARLDQGLACADRCLARSPTDYESRLVRAELCLAKGSDIRERRWLDVALAELDRAATLAGCQNRVNWLAAHARLQRAKHARTLGEDPSADLHEILRHRDSPTLDVPDPEPWLDVIRQAEALASQRDE